MKAVNTTLAEAGDTAGVIGSFLYHIRPGYERVYKPFIDINVPISTNCACRRTPWVEGSLALRYTFTDQLCAARKACWLATVTQYETCLVGMGELITHFRDVLEGYTMGSFESLFLEIDKMFADFRESFLATIETLSRTSLLSPEKWVPKEAVKDIREFIIPISSGSSHEYSGLSVFPPGFWGEAHDFPPLTPSESAVLDINILVKRIICGHTDTAWLEPSARVTPRTRFPTLVNGILCRIIRETDSFAVTRVQRPHSEGQRDDLSTPLRDEMFNDPLIGPVTPPHPLNLGAPPLQAMRAC